MPPGDRGKPQPVASVCQNVVEKKKSVPENSHHPLGFAVVELYYWVSKLMWINVVSGNLALIFIPLSSYILLSFPRGCAHGAWFHAALA